MANAHSLGATPWTRPDYVRKFRTLTEDILDSGEVTRFLQVAESLPSLSARDLPELTLSLPKGALAIGTQKGIF